MAFTDHWVEEEVFGARHFDAVAAAAASIVEDLVGSASCCNASVAFASAVVASPNIVGRAGLVEASACALFSVPVVTVVKAGFGGALPLASVCVEDELGVLFPDAFIEVGLALALAIVVVEVLARGAEPLVIAAAVASVPVEVVVHVADGIAHCPLTCADALAAAVVEDEMDGAALGRVDALAGGVVPSVAGGAKGSQASAAADCEAVVEVPANWARLLLANANFAVPELAAIAGFGFADPCAVHLIPVRICAGLRRVGQANAFVAIVVVVEVLAAVKRSPSALAPGLFPVHVGWAVLWVALASAFSSVPVETVWAGLGSTVANATRFIPEVARQAVDVGLDTAARADVPAPVDRLSTVDGVETESRVVVAVNWQALAVAGPFIPVHISINCLDA